MKTLKDLMNYDGYVNAKELRDRLRQEAINDIKELRDTNEDYVYLPNYKIGFYNQHEKTAVIEYIKYKNNITEEDLK